eukprot:scaffold1085_cov252-Pinguiococcus_pyrenoidosus.AAC.9
MPLFVQGASGCAPAEQQLREDAANGPHVDAACVVAGAQQKLWRSIPHRDNLWTWGNNALRAGEAGKLEREKRGKSAQTGAEDRAPRVSAGTLLVSCLPSATFRDRASPKSASLRHQSLPISKLLHLMSRWTMFF